MLDNSKKVDIKVKDKRVDQVLDLLLKGLSVNYEINDRQIILKNVKESTPKAQQQGKRTVVGLVKDEHGEAIIGASVQVAGTDAGTITESTACILLRFLQARLPSKCHLSDTSLRK